VERQVLGSTLRFAMFKATASLLFATSPWHLPTYLGVALALLLVAGVSGYIPARRDLVN
jgi:hypothetical protein